MFVELAFYVSENISHSSERCGRTQPSVCLCSASWLRSCTAEKTFECECVTLLRSGTLTVAFWLSRSPFPTLLFFSFTPLFARSPAKILFLVSHCLFLHLGWRSPSRMKSSRSSRKVSACVRRTHQESLLLSARNFILFIYLRWRRAFLGSPSSVVLTAVQRFSESR